jgi:hypothetical protein
MIGSQAGTLDSLISLTVAFEAQDSMSPWKITFVDRLPIGGILIVAFAAAVGCGGPQATVSGCITCQGKPVTGVVLFSSKATPGVEAGAQNSATAELSETGNYTVKLHGSGKYVVVVTPRDLSFRRKGGAPDFPCDRSPREIEVVAGNNDISFELAKRSR